MIGLLIIAAAGATIAVAVVVFLVLELARMRERLRRERAYRRAMLASEQEISAAWADVLERAVERAGSLTPEECASAMSRVRGGVD